MSEKSQEPLRISERYEIRREIGRGGMAVVYLARDRRTGGDVAVKVLRSELVASVSAARFLREIGYLRGLRHPNILPILDASEEGEPLYFVMPYAEGETLRLRLEQERLLPVGEVVRIVRELASALDYAHAQNIVHRDLKPENILFGGDHVLLADFGVARAIIVSSSEEVLSSSGIAVGTPAYMSPEMSLHDTPVDARCDVYSLGCVTYEMLTGEPPFTAASALALMASHIAQTPRPIRSVRPDVSVECEAAVHAAMAKESVNRPASGAAFLALLLREPSPVPR